MRGTQRRPGAGYSPNLGLVLSGGAARGAYEAGVLRYVFRELPRRLGFVPWPSVVSGTSVGALNGVFAVTHQEAMIDRMVGIWRNLTVDDVYRLSLRALGRRAVGWGLPRSEFAILDPAPLHGLLAREFPGRELRASIDEGRCRAFIVAATELATGYNSVFLDTRAQAVDVGDYPGARTYRTAITDVHCRASAAIPFLFPAVPVDGQYHVDGGLRQNTPLRPVLRAGVDRVLVVGLKQPREEEGAVPLVDVQPNLPFLAGKTLNALLLDPVERDLWQADHINQMVAWGTRRYGDDFAVRMRDELGIRKVAITYVRPSEDLGRMAAVVWRTRRPKVPATVRWLLEAIADRENLVEADLLSYLLFDRAFTAELEQLGFEDARRQEDALASLLTDVPSADVA